MAGRPTKYNDIDLNEVKEFAELGATMEELAGLLGISLATLYNYRDKHPEFLETLENSKNVADYKIVKSLYEKAIDGDVTAIKYWLTNRKPSQWKEKTEIGISNGEIVRIEIPEGKRAE